MGCCMSTDKAPDSASLSEKHLHSLVVVQPPRSSISRVKATECRAPPPVEEETVKEVLSEIPEWKPRITKLEPEKQAQRPVFVEVKEDSKIERKLLITKAEEISEASEICSLSESFSTTTITDKKDNHEEIRQRVNRSPGKLYKNQSFSGDYGGKRDRIMGKSPTRRSEQSPGKRNVGSVRLIQSRDQVGQSQTIGCRGLRTEPHRRDPNENSAKRSRSTATRTENGATRSIMGRSPSARRTNKSPARVRTDMSENDNRKLEQTRMESNWPSANESLENPLVSLECFIFL
ncbi:serine/arginine repetitive matrix protein 1-like [Quillaja saponaria]|uniref:Serine/arginine repetitive matrix protein 1-like n=1 Tax=Quillaja saponaria TaxID=32244 RepID=A0AAD7M2K0_QUISA|nr:serine/arginine repetitive matrix protein 1-like [Quillaja saponaria]